MNLIFVHVPKCGGTTIIDTLSNLSKRPLHIWPPENLFSIDDKQLFDADFIACHATLPAFKKRFGNKIENFKLITNLRNPVDRYISEFHQWVRGGHKITWNQYMQIESIQNKITQHLFGDPRKSFNENEICSTLNEFYAVFDMADLFTQLPLFLDQIGASDYKINSANRHGSDQSLTKVEIKSITKMNQSDIQIYKHYHHCPSGHLAFSN